MRKTLTLIAIVMGFSGFAQKNVCPGDPPIWCYVDGLPGSTFEWCAEGAEILENDNNRILLRWPAPGNYQLSVQETTVEGCMGETVSTVVYVNPVGDGDCRPTLIVPNIFTPNGDGINDVFSLKTEHLQFFELKIFSRWGKLLFESSDTRNSWDGKIMNRTADEGTYFWTVRYGDNDRVYTQKGNVYLKR